MYTFVLVTHSYDGKVTITVKGRFQTRDEATSAVYKATARCVTCHLPKPDYRVCDEGELQALRKKVAENVEKRRKAGAKRAAATRFAPRNET